MCMNIDIILASSISRTKSVTCFPAKGPIRSAEVLVPPTEVEVLPSPLLEEDAEAPAKVLPVLKVAITGPFVPKLPL